MHSMGRYNLRKKYRLLLLLWIIPIIVFVILFARLNFNLSNVDIDEEFFLEVEDESLQSALFSNVKVHRRRLSDRLENLPKDKFESGTKLTFTGEMEDFSDKNIGNEPKDTINPWVEQDFKISTQANNGIMDSIKTDIKIKEMYSIGALRLQTSKTVDSVTSARLNIDTTTTTKPILYDGLQKPSFTGTTQKSKMYIRIPKKTTNKDLSRTSLSKKRNTILSDMSSKTKEAVGINSRNEKADSKVSTENASLIRHVANGTKTVLNNHSRIRQILENENNTGTLNTVTSSSTGRSTNLHFHGLKSKPAVTEDGSTGGKQQTPMPHVTIQSAVGRTKQMKTGIIKTDFGAMIDIPEQLKINETLKDEIFGLLPMTNSQSADDMDRILKQMHHVPLSIRNINKTEPKIIYFLGQYRTPNRPIPEGSSFFEQCKVSNCVATYNESMAMKSDAVFFDNPGRLPIKPPFQKASQSQIWIMSTIETPPHTTNMANYRGLFNWTMTYRRDSIIATPYFKFRSFAKQNESSMNFAYGKTKMVAMFVSNCWLSNSGRLRYAKELAKYVSVDIYGKCGTHKCPKGNDTVCKEMLRKDYKFYLSFENSKCRDYMTEKVTKAYQFDTVPIVLGASPEEYRQVLPPGSYISAEEFSTPKKLAEYLHELDNNDALYNQYFRWKSQGEFIDTLTWCRVCSLLNEDLLPHIWYDDIEQWWGQDNVCIGKSKWNDD